MSDRFWAKIEIGGQLKRADLSAFQKLMNDWAPENISVQEYADKGWTIEFEDSEARYGQFVEVEEWCTKHGLTWSRQSDSYCDYDAEVVWYDPLGSKDDPRSLILTADGHANLRLDTLSSMIKAAKETSLEDAPLQVNDQDMVKRSAAKYMLETAGSIDRLELLEKILDDLYPSPPTIPPITII